MVSKHVRTIVMFYKEPIFLKERDLAALRLLGLASLEMTVLW